MLRFFATLAAAGAALPAAALPPDQTPRLGDARALTAAGAPFLLSPAWSPDGRWIACGGERWAGLHLVQPETGAVRPLTNAIGAGYHFAWSPDSREIAARCGTPQPDGTRLWTIRCFQSADGSAADCSPAVRELKWPVWSLNGDGQTRMNFVREGKRISLASRPLVQSAAMGPAARFLTGLEDELLLYIDRRIHLYPSDAGEPRPLTDAGCFDPVWSPDRTLVAWQRMDTLVVASRDGTAARDLGPATHPCWSPDGRWIAAQITADHTHEGEDTRTHTLSTAPHLHDDKTNHRIVESDLIIIRVETGERFPLTSTPGVLECDPAFSPDGTKLVWRTEDTGRLFIADVIR